MKWISVEENLPSRCSNVIAYNGSVYITGINWEFEWIGEHFKNSPVTHWMPLPDAPKFEANLKR